MLGRTERYKNFLKRAKTLYHGTIIDNLESIRRFGLIPYRGGFVEEFYSDSENEEELPELVFAADKNTINKAINAMLFHIGKKLNKWTSEVTEEDIKAHGLLTIIRGDPYTGEANSSFKQRKEDNKYDSWKEHPSTVEPDDYYTEDVVPNVDILVGNKLLNFLRRTALLPEHIEKDQRRELIKLLVERKGSGYRDAIVEKVKTLSNERVSQELKKELQLAEY
jgi:hypothetical protein